MSASVKFVFKCKYDNENFNKNNLFYLQNDMVTCMFFEYNICALDRICCSLNGTQHCSASLPPPATPLLKDYWHLLPFHWLVHVSTCDLHDI